MKNLFEQAASRLCTPVRAYNDNPSFKFNPKLASACISTMLLTGSTLNHVNANNNRSSIEQSGDWMQVIIPALTAADIASRENKHDSYEKITDMGKVFALGTVSTHTLKEAFSNTEWGTRPITAEQGGFGGKNFPSGHTTAAACPAIYHAHEYGDTRSALLLAGAAYTGYTRHHAKKHDFKAILGAFAVCEAAYHLGMGDTAKDHDYSLQPVIQGHDFGDDQIEYSIGLEYSIRF